MSTNGEVLYSPSWVLRSSSFKGAPSANEASAPAWPSVAPAAATHPASPISYSSVTYTNGVNSVGNGAGNGGHFEAVEDPSKPFRYSREFMMSLWDPRKVAELPIEFERWEVVTTETASQPLGLQELSEAEKKAFSGPFNPERPERVTRNSSTNDLSVNPPRRNNSGRPLASSGVTAGGPNSPRNERFGGIQNGALGGLGSGGIIGGALGGLGTNRRKKEDTSNGGDVSAHAPLPPSSGNSWRPKTRDPSTLETPPSYTGRERSTLNRKEEDSPSVERRWREPAFPPRTSSGDDVAEETSVGGGSILNSAARPGGWRDREKVKSSIKAESDAAALGGWSSVTSKNSDSEWKRNGKSTRASVEPEAATGSNANQNTFAAFTEPPEPAPKEEVTVSAEPVSSTESTPAVACKWNYQDHSGNLQGPFEAQEMQNWFMASYFPDSLLVKRVQDTVFETVATLKLLYPGDNMFLNASAAPAPPPPAPAAPIANLFHNISRGSTPAPYSGISSRVVSSSSAVGSPAVSERQVKQPTFQENAIQSPSLSHANSAWSSQQHQQQQQHSDYGYSNGGDAQPGYTRSAPIAQFQQQQNVSAWGQVSPQPQQQQQPQYQQQFAQSPYRAAAPATAGTPWSQYDPQQPHPQHYQQQHQQPQQHQEIQQPVYNGHQFQQWNQAPVGQVPIQNQSQGHIPQQQEYFQHMQMQQQQPEHQAYQQTQWPQQQSQLQAPLQSYVSPPAPIQETLPPVTEPESAIQQELEYVEAPAVEEPVPVPATAPVDETTRLRETLSSLEIANTEAPPPVKATRATQDESIPVVDPTPVVSPVIEGVQVPVAAPSPPVATPAPWLATEETKKPAGPSLREIQEAEQKRVAAAKAASRPPPSAATSAPASPGTPVEKVASWGLASSKPALAPVAAAPPLSTSPAPAVWGAGGQAMKLTLKQIQEQEEKARIADAQVKAQKMALTSGAGAKRAYADSAAVSAAASSAGAWSTVGASGKAVPTPAVSTVPGAVARPASLPPKPVTALPTSVPAKPITSIITSVKPATVGVDENGNPLPSAEFITWTKTALKGITGINIDEFIKMLLDFPLEPTPSILETISDIVYAYSSTLDGKRFAQEFTKRRKADVKISKEILKTQGPSAAPVPLRMADIVKAQPPKVANDFGAFKVVKKKGKKN